MITSKIKSSKFVFVLLEIFFKNIFEILEIINNSEKHIGHAGVENTSTMLTHVELRILNKNNLKKIDIHRTIHEKLESVFKSGLHSLEIKISNR